MPCSAETLPPNSPTRWYSAASTPSQSPLAVAPSTETCRLPSPTWPKNSEWWPGQRASNAARQASRSEEHTSELQSPCNLVCRLLLEKKKSEPVTKNTAIGHISMAGFPSLLSFLIYSCASTLIRDTTTTYYFAQDILFGRYACSPPAT